jgi:hypothetical protein
MGLILYSNRYNLFARTEWRCGLCESLTNLLKGIDEHLDQYTTSTSASTPSLAKRKAGPLGLNKWELKVINLSTFYFFRV